MKPVSPRARDDGRPHSAPPALSALIHLPKHAPPPPLRAQAEWIEYWLSMHDRLSEDSTDARWSQFMHLTMAFWSPSLSPIISALDEQGVDHIKRTYRSEADGLDM